MGQGALFNSVSLDTAAGDIGTTVVVGLVIFTGLVIAALIKKGLNAAK